MSVKLISILCCVLSNVYGSDTIAHVVLNGSSCSGKTAIARQIMLHWKTQNISYAYFSIDHLYHTLLNSLSPVQQEELPQLLQKAQEKKLTHPVIAIESWPDCMNKLFDDWFTEYFTAIKIKSHSILELVCDHELIFKKFLYNWCKNNKPALSFTKIQCSQSVAQERLNVRNKQKNISEHRDSNTVEANFNCLFTIHGLKKYDLEIDTSTITSEQAAEILLASPLGSTAMSNNLGIFKS